MTTGEKALREEGTGSADKLPGVDEDTLVKDASFNFRNCKLLFELVKLEVES